MTPQQIKESIYQFYGLHRRTKITLNELTFNVQLGDTLLELPLPKDVLRDQKINDILNGKSM